MNNLNIEQKLIRASFGIAVGAMACYIFPKHVLHNSKTTLIVALIFFILGLIQFVNYKYSKHTPLRIYNWTQKRYDYYDKMFGKYCGEKCTKSIFIQASERFNKTTEEIDELYWQGTKDHVAKMQIKSEKILKRKLKKRGVK